MFVFLFELSRSTKRIISLVIDSIFIFSAFWLALFIRHNDTDSFGFFHYWGLLSLVTVTSLLVFVKLGLYRAVLRYISVHALWSVIIAVCASTFLLIAYSFFLDISLSRTVPILYTTFGFMFIGGSRIFVRAMVSAANYRKKEPIIVYGAGSAGHQLATALASGTEYKVIAFIDDDTKKQRTTIKGIMVHSPEFIQKIIDKYQCTKLLLALPSESQTVRQHIINNVAHYSVKVLTIPGMDNLVNGDFDSNSIVEIEIEDLLGRDPVPPNKSLLHQDIANKNVMVSGAGGSIGSELCRQIIQQKPKCLLLFERSEFSLYSIEKELKELNEKHNLSVELIPLLGSVQHMRRLEKVYSHFKVQTVYHAAAYKHVPLVEYNIIEGVRNNVFGTLFAAKAAVKAKVETFVLISTDKAVRPTNVMGTTKRMSELILQALAKTKHNTRFSMVRFGNVLGSSGSVVPLFRKQIAEGGPITLTHKDITRFFMTIPEAAQLVIQAGAMGKGGDVFVLDMGESVKIKDLAEKMILLSGLTVKTEQEPTGDIEIKCTGLRPGEKLYEELLIGNNVSGTNHDRIMTAQEVMLPWSELEATLNQLDEACHNFDYPEIRKLLLDSPTGFNPTEGINDVVWNEIKKEKPIAVTDSSVIKLEQRK
jgi:FlaA1/EpsC-like NDP-sugar epimerase